MKNWWCLGLLAAAWLIPAMVRGETSPYGSDRPWMPVNRIDQVMLAFWQKNGLVPAPPASDAVLVRRLYLDVTGTLPTAAEAAAFIASTDPDKEPKLVDSLLGSKAYVDYWTMKWADLLRIKSEYPINLWPNAVQCYSRWVRNAVRDNWPYDRFARELLTASGSNFRTPPANFYRAVSEHNPNGIAAAVALTFMGVRTDKWTAAENAEFQKFFSRIVFKPTAAWKEEIVCDNPAPQPELAVRFPDGKTAVLSAGTDPRRAFADWLTAPGNPWFARAAANRTWFWIFGRGVVQEPDDLRPDNPPSAPELLAALEQELVRSGYDQRALLRLILTSATYRQASLRPGLPPVPAGAFAAYPVRRLDAEVIVDMLDRLTGTEEQYSSVIPEPFSFIPPEQSTVALADGSISSSLLEIFGRSARDSGYLTERNNQISCPQRLYLLNSNHLQRRLNNSAPVREMLARVHDRREAAYRELYLMVLSREPDRAELKTLSTLYPSRRPTVEKWVVQDLIWALVNSKEFLYRH